MLSQEVGNQVVCLGHSVPVDGPHREVVVVSAGQGLSQGRWEHNDVGRVWVVVKRLMQVPVLPLPPACYLLWEHA